MIRIPILLGAFVFSTSAVLCHAETYVLPSRAIEAVTGPELAGAGGVSRWTAEMKPAVKGFEQAVIADGRAGGVLGAAEVSFETAFDGEGLDLDLGFRDFVDVDLQLPSGFKGRVFLGFRTRGNDAQEGMERIALPERAWVADGTSRRLRIDVGLVPRWRGFLTSLALVIEPCGSRGTVALGCLKAGDRPGDVVEPNPELNLKPGMKVADLRKVESKHACIWWEPSHEKEGFDPQVMPRRALRMVEETWQVAVNQLGYRDPCLGVDPASKRRRKINHITWHGGFWMSGGDPPHFNVPEPGLRDEGWGNPVPHEFSHAVQAGQLNFLNGCHWESHANYLRFCRNLHFREFTGLDCIDFGVLMRSHYHQDHPRLIYADWRPYFYLDSDPDQLGLPPGLTAKLWQSGKPDEHFWEKLPSVLPAGVTRERVAAGIARSWLTLDFHGGDHFRKTLFGPDPEGLMRWFRMTTPLEPVADRPEWFGVPLARAPMKFGWCVHELEARGPLVEAVLEGIDLAGEGEDWRWGFVSLAADGRATTSDVFKPGKGSFRVPASNDKLMLFVVATPADARISYAKPTPDLAVDRCSELRRYPYEIRLRAAAPALRKVPVGVEGCLPHPNGGGLVSREARVDASAFVGPEARVLGNAKVLGKARILDRAVVMDSATVSDRAEVSGLAVVRGEARVSGDARIRNHALVGAASKIGERARVGDLADLQESTEAQGDAWLRGVTAPLGGSKIGGHAILDADYAMAFPLNDGVHFHHIPWGGWYFDEVAAKLTKPRGLLASYRFLEKDGDQALDEFGALVATLRGHPQRVPGGLRMDGAEDHVLLDASLLDVPAATWLVRAKPSTVKAQVWFSAKGRGEDGIALGLRNGGQPVAILTAQGHPKLVLAAAKPVSAGTVATLGLRMDGAKACLFVNGKPAATASWDLPPCVWYHDTPDVPPPVLRLGSDGRGAASGIELSGFRAFLVPLSDPEIASPAFAGSTES